jgi:type IV pilus assembly protein PilV
MSLLEVMIAVLVFSVGILGVAALMLTSMRNNDATLARTQSTVLANEIYEKMLANLPGAVAGNYTIDMTSALPVSTSINCADATANCSTADLATWDLVQWSTRIGRVLFKSA